MATLNGIVANEKSMSGVVESPIGETIDCDVLNAPTINTQYINAIDDFLPSTLYENQTDTITIGTSGTNTINLGSFQFFLDNIRSATATLSLYLFSTSTAIIYFAQNASQIVFGSSTALVSAFVPTANNHLTNKLYVDNVVSGASLLTTNNTWTGTNTFSSAFGNKFGIDNTIAGSRVALNFNTYSTNYNTITGQMLITNGGTTFGSADITYNFVNSNYPSGSQVNFQNGAVVRYYASCNVSRYVNSGSFLLYSGDTTIRTNTTTVNLSPSTWLNDSTYIIPFSRTTAVNFNLSIVASEMRDGSWINIVNQSSANCPIATSTDTRMFGEEPTARCTRGGQAFIVCGSNRAVRIRCMENLTGYLSNTAYTFGYFCSVIG